MKKLLCATLTAGLLVTATMGPAQAQISGNVTLATDYIFRGVSQTSGGPTIQGGFDYEHESGFYLGTWGSNVGFGESVEVDYYGGFAGDLTDAIGFDAGYIFYDYPGAGYQDLDFQEIHGSLSFAGFTGSLAYTDDIGGAESLNYGIAYDVDLSNDFSLSIFGGLSTYDDDFWGDEDSYVDYGVSLNYSTGGLDFGLSVTDTDLDESDCGSSGNCDTTLVFSISKSL